MYTYPKWIFSWCVLAWDYSSTETCPSNWKGAAVVTLNDSPQPTPILTSHG